MAEDSELRSALALVDWRRRVFSLYSRIRNDADPEAAWRLWRDVRDALFRDHQQSPLAVDRRRGFEGIALYPYDPSLRVLASVTPAKGDAVELPDSGASPRLFRRLGWAEFELGGANQRLGLFWLAEYAGGVFLAFTDATTGGETYDGGRYLLDTAKGSDLGSVDDRLVLDFNFAYQPSCSYDDHWACPLSPAENRLAVPIRGGERAPRRDE